MTKEIKEFLEEIINRDTKDFGYQDIEQLQDQATILLYEDFKTKVLDAFDYELYHRVSNDRVIEAIKDHDKFELIRVVWSSEAEDFIKENFNKLDVIIEILQEKLKEMENENE